MVYDKNYSRPAFIVTCSSFVFGLGFAFNVFVHVLSGSNG